MSTEDLKVPEDVQAEVDAAIEKEGEAYEQALLDGLAKQTVAMKDTPKSDG